MRLLTLLPLLLLPACSTTDWKAVDSTLRRADAVVGLYAERPDLERELKADLIDLRSEAAPILAVTGALAEGNELPDPTTDILTLLDFADKIIAKHLDGEEHADRRRIAQEVLLGVRLALVVAGVDVPQPGGME